MFLLVLYLVISTLAVACNDGEASAKCESASCETVGTTQICTQCNTDYVPINGKCVAKADAQEKCTDASGSQASSQTCAKCAGKTFMFKSGCYETTSPAGQQLCTEAAAGVCTTAAPGYFLNPLKASDKVSVVSCSDTTGFAEAGKTYTGVDGCATCTAPEPISDSSSTKAATCTRCQGQKYLKGNTCVENAAACSDGYAGKEDTENGNKCLACTDQENGGTTDCATCEYNTAASKIKCTKCTSNYLKTAADGTTTCVTECGNGYFKKDNGGSNGQTKVCSPCAANCLACVDETADKCTSCTAGTHFLLAATGSQGKCVSCGDETSGVPNCAKCTAPSQEGQKPACSECGSGYKLEGNTCVPASTNLSTGAIAGISVAAVVVVGGLVGFLCWWFVCRGKA